MARSLYNVVVARVATIESLASLAEDQWGLVTRQQAEGVGLAWTTISRLAAEESVLERVAQGVYRLRGAPPADHLELRAAWLQLAPGIPVWQRTIDQGVVSHRSAASVYRLGDLLAERHEFTFPRRRQSRRSDIRIHRSSLRRGDWANLKGLLITKPARIAADLLADGEDPDSVAQIVAKALRQSNDRPRSFAVSLEPLAQRFGLRKGDGLAVLRWLLELGGDPNTAFWLQQATAHMKESWEPDDEAVRG
jgi:predicted transcriptional regulator of viral defense system